MNMTSAADASSQAVSPVSTFGIGHLHAGSGRRGYLTAGQGLAGISSCFGAVNFFVMISWEDEDFCYVTTTGRHTGNPHQIEIWFGTDGDTIYLLSGGGDRSDWFKNLRADPAVLVRIADREWQAKARVVEDRDEDARARRLLAAKYQGWKEGKPMSGWATTALPVAIDLQAREAVR